MAFIPRQPGITLRREAEDAFYRPHGAEERFDPEINIIFRCELCGKHAYGPRKYMDAAIAEHRESVCPMRHTKSGVPLVTRYFVPRQ